MEEKQTGKAVYKAIAAVQGDMAAIGISKDSKNQQQGFMFRGIDAVYNALAPLLAKHKLCIIPRCQSRVQTERESKSGGALFSVVLDVEYDVVSGEDGSVHIARLPAEAMDSADKATNKAMSAAYKYLCLQMFCIPTEGESPDADKESHEVKGKEQGGDQRNMLVTKIKEITPTNSPKFFNILTAEGRKMGIGDPDLIAIANEVIKTGEDVRLHFEVDGRFTDLTAIDRREPPAKPAAPPAPAAPAERTAPAAQTDPIAAMSPSSGHEFASGVVTAKIATKAAGFMGWYIDQQQNADGSQMVFASKSKAHNALMADFLKTEHKVKVEYMRAKKEGMANIICEVRAEPLDEIPF
jgi:hypothetical protein